VVYILSFIIGSVVGSFLNVCIYRLPRQINFWSGRSYCPRCNKKIAWYDNIPLISYWLLNGQCRKCKKKISSQYFLIELVTALGFLIIVFQYDLFLDQILLAMLLSIFIVIFFIDLKHFIIPDALNFLLIIIGIFKNFLQPLNIPLNQNMQESLIGGLLGYMMIWLIIYAYKKIKNIEGMGLGDAKLLAAFGFLFGYSALPIILFLAACLGLIFALPALIRKTKSLKSELPFGPFLILATLLYAFYFKNLNIFIL